MRLRTIVFIITLMLFASFCAAEHPKFVYIDAGHGGPGASQTNNGGGYNNGNGAEGPYYGLAEQWVNLSVALELRDLLGSGNCVLTRDTDTANVAYQTRAQMSDSGEVFLSIHHNGLGPGFASGQSKTGSAVKRCRCLVQKLHQDSS